MIACHSWDLEVAMYVGLQTGYIKSYEQSLFHSITIPDYEGDNILKLSENIFFNSVRSTHRHLILHPILGN